MTRKYSISEGLKPTWMGERLKVYLRDSFLPEKLLFVLEEEIADVPKDRKYCVVTPGETPDELLRLYNGGATAVVIHNNLSVRNFGE